MSEKHLTELPWKMLAVKHKVKDIGLQKSLLAYSKIEAAKDPPKATECLADIVEVAVKLKKANQGNGDVVDYLDEVVKEANKTKASVAALAKTKPPEKPAAEEEDGPDIKSRLVNALKKLKVPDA